MKLRDIKKSLNPLLEDAFESEILLNSNKSSQFARRTYVRTLFSYIEGTIWILKQVCLNAEAPKSNVRSIEIGELLILREEMFELKSNGSIKKTALHLNLLDNLKFIFKTLNRLFVGHIELGTGTANWTNLIEAKKIRNRITHPKDSESFEISDEEIKLCQEVCSWFNILIKKSFDSWVNTSQNQNKTE